MVENGTRTSVDFNLPGEFPTSFICSYWRDAVSDSQQTWKKNTERTIKHGEHDRSWGSHFQGSFGYRGPHVICLRFRIMVWKPFYFSAVVFVLCCNVSCGLPEIKQMKEIKKVLRHYRHALTSQWSVGLGHLVKELGAICWGKWNMKMGRWWTDWRKQDRKEGTPHAISSPWSPGETLALCVYSSWMQVGGPNP